MNMEQEQSSWEQENTISSVKPEQKPRSSLKIIIIASLLAMFGVLILSGTFHVGSSGDAVVTVSFIAALIGGFLSLISPCSAAMLPVFFAYSFKEKRQLVKMTFVFYLGLATLFVPLGFSASFVTNLFFKNQLFFFNVAGAIFILLGFFIFLGKSWQWLPKRMRNQDLSSGKKSVGTIYVMGLLFSFATGTCSAPIIGGILTLASTSSSSITAVLLLLTYAFGLVLPMFIMAWFFDRYNFANSRLVRGKSWGISIFGNTFNIHSTNIITAVLFISIGILFIITKGTNLFLESFGTLGLTDLYYNVNASVLSATANLPNWPFYVLFIGIVIWYWYRIKQKN
jgi:cytochrome c biogenesis protein CcdA